MHLENAYELHMMNQCRHHMPIQGHKPIDLLEVYASSSSRLTNEVNKRGGVAKRFTFEDGDLSTTEGQIKLFRKIFLWKPRHIWLAPECGPWSPWNRLNQTKSMESYSRIRESQATSKDQLYMCDLICKIQLDRGDHFHLEKTFRNVATGRNARNMRSYQASLLRSVSVRFKASIFARTDAKEHPCTNLIRGNV